MVIVFRELLDRRDRGAMGRKEGDEWRGEGGGTGARFVGARLSVD